MVTPPPCQPRKSVWRGTDNADDELGFKVLRKTGLGQFGEIADLPPNSTGYTDNGSEGLGLTPGTEYDYHIQEYNIAGYSDFTGFTIQTRTLSPLELSAVASSQQIALHWSAPANNLDPGELTYNVYRGTTAGEESPTPIASGLSSTDFIDTDVVPGMTYFYTATATDTGGESEASFEASTVAAPDTTPPFSCERDLFLSEFADPTGC